MADEVTIYWSSSISDNVSVGSGGGYESGSGALRPIGVAPLVNTGAALYQVRTPSAFHTTTASSSGNTAVWTPQTGNKFRLMGYVIYLTGDATLGSAGDLEVTFQDNTTAIGLGFSSYVPGALTAGEVTLTSGVVQLGNGYVSTAANNVLHINLATALASGECRVTVWGTEGASP